MHVLTATSSLVTGGAVSHIPSNSTGLNPAWRRAVAHTVISTSWPEGANASQIETAREGLRRDTAKLRALAPESGAYFNEVRAVKYLRASIMLIGVDNG